ncbi:glycerol-3-phosphate 1-O-acyltransferase PlsY [Bacillus sp. Marseille-Q1617]|uniref:glycerol-3-phosphate 1-O-acyltransferase PlsY n=1 Tax=Bacillus sp. Marseille-Q1617 TaxID=2736887 RepID=UPI001589C0B1|nr:glycerol-3-phosphate 1-O-acyltransferase PlsY [Bacillus sp. Marseille-Q1617]
MIYALILVIAYILGSIPSGLIIGKKFYGIDIREHGSGNLGGTNTFRTLGVKAGMVVTIMDILKGTAATLLPLFFSVEPKMFMLVAGIFAVIGHMYPLFANFRGGKAVATSGGVLLGYDPLLFLILLAVFFLGLYVSKYVSLSSMLAAIIAFTYTLFTGDIPLMTVVGVLAFFVIYRHRANIVRIKNRTEPKIKWL